jgi:hypothetical protein
MLNRYAEERGLDLIGGGSLTLRNESQRAACAALVVSEVEAASPGAAIGFA